MQDNHSKDKKGLKTLVFIIAAYILVVCGIALYVKLNRGTELVGDTKDMQQEAPKTKKKRTLDEIYAETQEENKTSVLNVEDEPLEALSDIEFITEESEDEAFEREYAKYLGSSLADVPARPLGEDNNANGEEVLIVSDLSHEVVESKGFFAAIGDFFGGIIDNIYYYFNDEEDTKPKKMSKEAASMLAEIDGEIGEMQSHFSLYKESNGVTYIDHLNKPMVLESNGFYIYIGVAPNGFTFHRTIIRYSGDEDIDLQSILVQTASSAKASIIDAAEGVLQKKFTTSANEWVDLPPTQENNALLNSVVSSDNVKITFMGAKKNVDWTLTENELITLKESLHFYNLLKEKEELSK